MSQKRQRRKKPKEPAAPEPRPPSLVDALARGADRLARTRWAFPAILAALCVAVYARSLPLGLVDFDDDVYIFEDPRLEGLSISNVGRILTRSFFSNYHPVTTLTYAFDRAVWGKWLPGFRLTHLTFYAGGVVLLYYLFRSLLGSAASSEQRCRPDRAWTAFVAAAVYAAHAIHVEAVAWLAQRKDVVCLVFYTASILAYVRYSRGGERRWRFYAASVGLAVLACLSKGYAVVLPAVLLAYDLCFAKGLGRPESAPLAARPNGGHKLFRKVADKLPYVAISAAVTVQTFLAQGEGSALVESPYTAWQRPVILCKVLAVYVGKAVLPVRLSAFYLVGTRWPALWTAPVGLALAAGAVAGFVLLRKRQPAAAFGIALFVLPLATVMNVFFTLRIWLADRYLFFPTAGSSLAFAAGGLWLYRRAPGSERHGRFRAGAGPHRQACALTAGARGPPVGWVLGASAACVVAAYSALTVARIPVWKGPVELWSDALRKHAGVPGSGPIVAGDLARTDQRRLSRRLITALAQAYGRAGEVGEAEALLAGLKPPAEGKKTGSELALAQLAVEKGRYDEAIELARKVADDGTWLAPKGWALIGYASAQKGDYDAARQAFLKSLEMYRESGRSGAGVMQDLGLVELRSDSPEKAVEWYRRAQEAAPEDHRYAFGLALACERAGRLAEALELYEEVLRRDPDHPERKVIAATIKRLRKASSTTAPQ